MVGVFIMLSRVEGARRLEGSHFVLTVCGVICCERGGWKQNQAARDGGGI
jgi:hypothetical protein